MSFTIAKLYPPIGAASVVFILWVIVAHRLYKRDLPKGDESFLQIIWLLLMPGAAGAFLYFHKDAPVLSPFEIFMTALCGISMGSVAIFALNEAFFTKSKTIAERVYVVGAALFFLALMFVMPFY